MFSKKEFKKAFVQEKAIYKRSEENLRGIIDLLRITIDEEKYEDAREIVAFVIEKAPTPEVRLEGYQYLMDVELKLATPEEYPRIEKQYVALFEEFGLGTATLAFKLITITFWPFETDVAPMPSKISNNC